MTRFVPPSGPYLALSQELCRCGFYRGSNMGRCLACFDYYGEIQLANYLDWMIEHDFPAKRFEVEAARVLSYHGSMVSP